MSARKRRVQTATRVWMGVFLVSFVVVLGTPAVGAEDASLPTAEKVLSRYVDALGGEKALRAHSSLMASGRFEMPGMGLMGNVEVLSAAPDKLLIKISLESVGMISTGFDGETAWLDNPMTGPMILEGELREEFLRQADFYAELNYGRHYPTMETVEKVTFGDEETYKLRLLDASDNEMFQYFSVESGLLVGSEGEQMTEAGRVFVTNKISEYRELGGRLVPTVTGQEAMGMEQNMVFEDVTYDQVDPDVFALPAVIEALVEVEGSEEL